MEKRKDQDKDLDTQYADDMISMDIVSATEVTGMVPTPPLTQAQAEGYRSLFPVPQDIAASAQQADAPEEEESL